jgi:hypothetical protein
MKNLKKIIVGLFIVSALIAPFFAAVPAEAAAGDNCVWNWTKPPTYDRPREGSMWLFEYEVKLFCILEYDEQDNALEKATVNAFWFTSSLKQVVAPVTATPSVCYADLVGTISVCSLSFVDGGNINDALGPYALWAYTNQVVAIATLEYEDTNNTVVVAAPKPAPAPPISFNPWMGLYQTQAVMEPSIAFDENTGGNNTVRFIATTKMATPPIVLGTFVDHNTIRFNYDVDTYMIQDYWDWGIGRLRVGIKYLGSPPTSPPSPGIALRAKVTQNGTNENVPSIVNGPGNWIDLKLGEEVTLISAVDAELTWQEGTETGGFSIKVQPTDGYTAGDQVLLQITKLSWKEQGGDVELIWEYADPVPIPGEGMVIYAGDQGSQSNTVVVGVGTADWTTVSMETKLFPNGWGYANFGVYIDEFNVFQPKDGHLDVTIYGVEGTTNVGANQGVKIGPGLEDLNPDIAGGTSEQGHLSEGETLVLSGAGSTTWPAGDPEWGYFNIATGDKPHEIVFQVQKVEWVEDDGCGGSCVTYVLWESDE